MQVRALLSVLIALLLLALAPVAEAYWSDRESFLLHDALLQMPFPSPGPPPGPPDLVITVLDTPDPVLPGGSLTYTINVGNFGRGESRGTVVRLDIPPGTSLNSLGNGCYLLDNAVWCQLLPLAPGAKATFTIAVDVVAPIGALTTMAIVDPANTVFENDRTNNSALTTTIVGRGTPGTSTPTTRSFPAAAPLPAATSVPSLLAAPAPASVPVAQSPPVLAVAPAVTPRPIQAAPPYSATSLSGTASEMWLLALAPTEVYLIRDSRVGQAPTGAWYKVMIQEGTWVLAVGEGESPLSAGWIEIDNRVQVIPGPRRVPSSTSEPWLVVLAPTQIYSSGGAPEWIAAAGERYRVISRDQGWALAIWEGDPPSRTVWVEVDSRVQLLGADQSGGPPRR